MVLCQRCGKESFDVLCGSCKVKAQQAEEKAVSANTGIAKVEREGSDVSAMVKKPRRKKEIASGMARRKGKTP